MNNEMPVETAEQKTAMAWLQKEGFRFGVWLDTFEDENGTACTMVRRRGAMSEYLEIEPDGTIH